VTKARKQITQWITGQGPEYTHLNWRITDYQQVNEKNDQYQNNQGNSNKKHNVLTSHTLASDIYQKDEWYTGKDVKKKISVCFSENVK
jgi:hypothetical protein